MLELRAIESFFVGGRDIVLSGLPVTEWKSPAGKTSFPIDPNGACVTGQMYVQAFRQQHPRHALPVLLWHGGGLTGTCWETTPDGRPGWLMWFLNQGFDVLVSDAMERGRANWNRWPEVYASEPFFRTKGEAWETFRIGPRGSWHDAPGQRTAYAPMLFPVAAMDAFARQFAPRWAGHEQMILDAYYALLDRVGPCIVIAHSQGGGFALQAAAERPESVRGVVVLEPSDAPALPVAGALSPHLVMWGDRVDEHPNWKRFRGIVDGYGAAIAAGGTAMRVMDLPAMGIAGNSHMLMMDANSDRLAGLVTDWLLETGLA